jgi:hypothetical protein
MTWNEVENKVEERERERGREKEEGGRTIVSRWFLVVSRNAQACVDCRLQR